MSETPWTNGKLTLTKAVLEALVAETVAAYGRHEEACGWLVGPAESALAVDRAVLVPNLANKYHAVDPETYPRTGEKYFLLDSRKFERAIAEGKTNGAPVKVLWHSHLEVGSYFSETDAAAAKMGGDEPANPLAYLVTSIRQGVVDDHKLFVWDAASKSFVESSFSVVDGA